MSSRDVRPSPIAGRWYPGSASQLVDSVDAYLSSPDLPSIDGAIIGLMVPHAGHHYSGPVAGRAFALVRDLDVDVVALIGPSHYPYPSPIVTSGHSAYVTPLGEVPIDRDLCEALAKRLPIAPVRHDQEHSLEIELPFLQRVLKNFRLVPLALIDQSWHMAQRLGAELARLLAGHKVLLVASSDLSHFYPQSIANTLDHALLEAVAANDPQAVIALDEARTGFACGRGAIAAVMVAAQKLGANSSQIVGYATSGDVSGDYQRVVGYGAAVFYQARLPD